MAPGARESCCKCTLLKRTQTVAMAHNVPCEFSQQQIRPAVARIARRSALSRNEACWYGYIV